MNTTKRTYEKYNFDEIIDRTNTNSLKYDFKELLFGTVDLLPMWVADMDFKTPDFIINAIRERAEHEIYGYTLRPDSFYNSIIKWLDKRHNWKIKKDWISFSPGVVPAISMIILGFTSPGNKIIVQPPVYYPFFSVIKENNRVIINNPLKLENGRYYMDFENLESVIDSEVKILILCNPHNPGGSVWTNKELSQLGNLCLKHELLIIADEIHSDLILKNNKFTPMASLSENIAKNVITCMAPSKTFNLAGLSTSFVICSNKDIIEKYKKMLSALHLGMGNIFGMVALESSYTYGEEWLNQLLDYLSSNLEFLTSFINKNIPEIKIIKPEATYLVWLDFRGLEMNNKELKNFLIHKAKLGFNDGPTFGQGGEGFQRMNIACPRAQLEKALGQLKNAIKSI